MEKVFAVLVDGENFNSDGFVRVLAEVEKHGAVAIKWVYSDWTNSRSKSWKSVLESTASRPKQQFHYTKKDDADHSLIMDAIELINNNARINSVCLVTSDGGFASLAQRIREYGVYSMVIGEKKAPKKLIRACENFVDVDNIDLQDSVELDNELELDDLLIKAFHRCSDDEGEAYLGNYGTAIKRIDPSFDYRSYKVASLKKLIKSRNNIFEVTQETNDRFYFKLKLDVSSTKVKVVKVFKTKGYGFASDGITDFYIHNSELVNPQDWSKVNVGSQLSFEYSANALTNGAELRAINISVL